MFAGSQPSVIPDIMMIVAMVLPLPEILQGPFIVCPINLLHFTQGFMKGIIVCLCCSSKFYEIVRSDGGNKARGGRENTKAYDICYTVMNDHN